MGWKVPITGSWTLSMANFIDAAGRNADGARMPQTFIEEANNSPHRLHRRLPPQLRGQAHGLGGFRRPGV